MRQRSTPVRTTIVSLLGAVALYGLLGGLVAPPVAKWVLERELREQLGRAVAIDGVTINPYTLQVSVKGLRIAEPDGAASFVAFDELDIDGSAASLYRLAPVIDELTLSGLRIRLVRESDTRYNATDILERFARKAQAARAAAQPGREDEPARFSVENIRVVGAAVDFDDRPMRVKHRIDRVQVAIPFVSNLPVHLKDQVRPSFTALVNGAPVRLAGEALPFQDTVRTHLDLELRSVDLPHYLAYIPAGLPVRLDSGRLDARISLRFTQAPGRTPAVDLAGTASVGNVALSGAEGPLGRLDRLEAEIASFDPLGGALKIGALRLAGATAMQGQWKVASVDARDIGVDLAKRTVRVASVATANGELALRRNADGSFERPRVAAGGSEPPAKWDVALASLRLTGFAVSIADAAVKPAITHRVALASLEGENLSTDKGFSGAAAAKLQVGKAGAVDLSSTFALQPLAVKATVDARGIDLVPLRAYVAQFPSVAVKSVSASAKGTATLQGGGDAMRVTYAGFAELADLATTDTIHKEDLLNWKSVRSNGIHLDFSASGPLRLAVADVMVDRAYSRMVVTPEGKLNLQHLRHATAADRGAAAAPAPSPPRARDIRIDRIRFVDSRLNFTDHFIKPNYTADVKGLQGTVTGLSSEPRSRADVELRGRWDEASPVTIAGKVNPLGGELFADIAARGEQIDLTRMTAYSQRYAGYGIVGGRLTLDVRYRIEGGKMAGRNRILVDQLAMGDKVESPDATTLPVLFAIKLLKDANGRIDLELPVSGSLEDPKFEFAAVIGQVVRNLFGKAASSPFSLIAAAAGPDAGEPEELAFIEFEPGAAEIPPAGAKKLQTLVKLLQARPGVQLEVASRIDPARDVEALKAAALQVKLAAAPKDLAREAREKLEKEPIVVSEAELAALAAKRAEQVKGYLVAAGRLPADRVVLASGAPPSMEGSKAKLSRVDFALR